MWKENEAAWDWRLRSGAGALFVGLGFGGLVDGWAGILVGIAGAVFLLTGATGYCPLYRWLGVDTLNGDSREERSPPSEPQGHNPVDVAMRSRN